MDYKKVRKLKRQAASNIYKIKKAYDRHKIACKVNNCEYISTNLQQLSDMLNFLVDAMDGKVHYSESLEIALSTFNNPHVIDDMSLDDVRSVLEILYHAFKEVDNKVACRALSLAIHHIRSTRFSDT